MKIGVCGAAGRMGRAIIGLVRSAEDLELTAAVEAPGHPDYGRDAGEVAGVGRLGVPIAAELAGSPDAVIDFSSPKAARAVARVCRERKIPLVVGTTGLSDGDQDEIAKTAKVVPVVFSPNMSVGVNLLFDLAPKVAKALGDGYDIEIVEMHHRFKKDAPSGTAVKLGEEIAHALKVSLKDIADHGREGLVGERQAGHIGFHAVRGGDVVGDHTVVFAGLGERVELVHKAGSRECFARGALRAARFVRGHKPGLFNMKDVLGL